MANGHGGAREGAGRIAKAVKYETEISATERFIADRLEQLRDNEYALATGGAERVEECYELARGITVDSFAINPSGVIVKIKKQLFPDAADDDMVLVSRKVITPEPDRAAIEYLIDRVLGKPTALVEAEITHDAGGALLEVFGNALTKIYGTDIEADAGPGHLKPDEQIKPDECDA